MRYRFAGYEMQWKANCIPIKSDAMSVLFESKSSASPEFVFEEVLMPEGFLDNTKRLKYTCDYEIYETNRGLFLLNHWATCRVAFGFYLSELDSDTQIYFHPNMATAHPMTMSYYLSTIGLHHKLLMKNVATVHASYVEVENKAVLFLGPSGTGKSTQAQLWADYAGAKIINGDRALLQKVDGEWRAYGCPFCGSSSICVNQDLPIAAIVVLQQSDYNKVEELTASRRITSLSCATELYPWDKWELDRVFDLSQQIATDVPVLRLSCTPDKRAVDALKNSLENLL